MVETTKKEERVIVQCVDAFKDSERANCLIVPLMRLSVTPAKAKHLGLINDHKMRFSLDNQLFLYVLNNTYEINVMILLKRLRSIQQSSINLIFFSILII